MSYTNEGLDRAESYAVATRAELVDAIAAEGLPADDATALLVANLTQLGYTAQAAANAMGRVLRAYKAESA